ncbi:MAG: hypothetical protein KC940_00955, partial [Candidatus Omnitrophica bacterium]|nr:hypothetical protein [Candidatus Omnitrophota bacterium]
GEVQIRYGELDDLSIHWGEGNIEDSHFQMEASDPVRIDVTISKARIEPGPGATAIEVTSATQSFAFFLRDVSSSRPIHLSEYGIIVTTSEDSRSFSEISGAIESPERKTRLEEYQDREEPDFQSAGKITRHMHLPVWLGLGRDIRFFEIATQYNQLLPEPQKTDLIVLRNYGEGIQTMPFLLGMGVNAVETMTRTLEEGCLPILHGTRTQGKIEYRMTAFATLETSPLTDENISGTHYLAVDHFSGENTRRAWIPEQAADAEKILETELVSSREKPVLFFRAEAENLGDTPNYAHFLVPNPNTRLDDQRGFYMTNEGNEVLSIATLNGRPLVNEEISILLSPGEVATLECRIPHGPVSLERAERIAEQDFEIRHAETRAFWKAKLDQAAEMRVPEREIDELIRAGFLHLQLLLFGRDGVLAPGTGYGPIGTESAPIIQFLDSMGAHGLAEQAIDYFFAKQHDDGFMQNYGSYQAETGPVLWTIGEHFRYTRDKEWANRVAKKALLSCEYIINRRRESSGKPMGEGKGMLSGNVGDPEDPFPSFTLNGYAYLGLARIGEMFEAIGHPEAGRIRDEARAFREDIRKNFRKTLAVSPVIPLGDCRWIPSAAPWAAGHGPVILYADQGQAHWYTHGSLVTRDALVGPLYLAFTEVFSPDEVEAKWLNEMQTELFTVENVVPTQPYYSRHPWLQLQQGYVGAFLQAYYHTVTSTIDREVYSFKEHPYGGTVYKTHEEAWFLMQSRWMLYQEEGDTLSLLSGIPRAWMEDGKEIRLKDAASYFGPINLEVKSNLDEGEILADIQCDT